MTATFAEIIIPQKINQSNQETLTYQIPEQLLSEIKRGMLVEIPLRKKQIRGIIWKIHQEKPSYQTREILKISENAPHLNDYQLELIEFIKDYYFCPYFKVIKLFIPAGFFNKKKIVPLTEAQLKIKESKIFDAPKLTEEQSKALNLIESSQEKLFLLHGITGSGKTEIYCQLTEKLNKAEQNNQKQALILVPEIALTPQTVANFEKRFGKNIAIIHSRLTPKQKEVYWQKIAQQKAKIVIGSRSAIFAPFQNLGLIIIDEEHEDSYKQDQAPRYHARTIAEKISELLKIKVVFGSATPAIESYFKALNKQYQLIELKSRIPFQTAEGPKEKPLPEVEIIDLREELKKKNYSIFSEKLYESLKNTLAENKQSILFLNRRGAASALLCRECGHSPKCSDCQTNLTYHNKLHLEEGIYQTSRLICHHCGKISNPPNACPNCQGVQIKHLGIGTQKIEDYTKTVFPKAKVLRADKDTTQKRDQFEIIYHAFKDHLADILIGTQMIGKGLHLPQVTLVGIILADLSLTIPDFRSTEKTFQLITQVAGRAGRETSGKVIIQTYLPENFAIQAAQEHNYQKFYQQEISLREELKYPPFAKLLKLTIENSDQEAAYLETQSLLQKLNDALDQNPINSNLIDQINAFPAFIPKLKNKYRWHLLLSGANPQQFLKNFSYKNPLNDDIKIDVDPTNTI